MRAMTDLACSSRPSGYGDETASAAISYLGELQPGGLHETASQVGPRTGARPAPSRLGCR